MKLPFSHKGREDNIPVDAVRKLREQGKSDREIIIELKNKNYPFQMIEKAMLQVLKSGTAQDFKNVPGQNAGNAYTLTPENQGNQPPGTQPPMPPTQAQGRGVPTREELMPKQDFPSFQSQGQEGSFESQFEPTDLIEEVVEGVVEEKFEKLDTKFEFIHKEHEKLKHDAETLKNLFGASIQKRDRAIENLRGDIVKLKEDMDDIVIKSNALERAFKQFLPELTEKARKKHLAEKGVEVIE
ncbi:MAG: hypothetical protein KAU95_04245 [Candidatus Aenigmarchaeota archaeon]|nr:hypothetical protein [Candidatus Aenigmarchaeota archaeon]